MGTGGLAYVLAKDNDATAVVAIGRQTVSPEKPSGHATKAFISERAASIDRFVAIHGMTSGKVLGGQDDTEIQAILGLGAQPNERTYEFAKKVKNHAKDILGLRVTLGEEDYIILAGDPLAFKRSENGEVKKISTKRIEPKFNRYTY